MDENGLVEPITDRRGLSTAKWEMEFERKGRRSLLGFGTADMDFKSPRPVIQALEEAVKRGHFGYPFRGPGYYSAIQGYFQRKFGWQVEREWIQGATGIYPSMGLLVLELTAPGDEIIYQTPVHQMFEELIRTNQRTPIANPLRVVGAQYEMDLKHLQRVITPRTKLLYLCSPHNPVGRVWTRAELTALHEICHRNGIVIISDEVYSGLLFPGASFTPMAALSPAASRNTITVGGASKSFNITGLKHSLVIAANEQHRAAYEQAMRRTNMNFGGSLLGQIATETAFRDCDRWSEELMGLVVRNFAITKDFLVNHIPSARIYDAGATFFAWVDFSFMALTDDELMTFFEDEANIIASWGHILGPGGKGHVRLNLGCTREMLLEGLSRIREAVGNR
jgi:cysteine-S-conjugate beta-lyase